MGEEKQVTDEFCQRFYMADDRIMITEDEKIKKPAQTPGRLAKLQTPM
jgi:hypothetical protein